MEWRQLSLLVIFSISMLGSPGPATMSLAASGATYGYRASLPFLGGIILGFFGNLLAAALGLGVLFVEYPAVHTVFRYVSLVYILYLGVRIFFSKPAELENTQPLRFGQGVILNLLNPKAYVAAIAAITQFTAAGDRYYESMVIVIAVNLVLAFVLQLGWVYAGHLVGRGGALSSPRVARVVNAVLALAMVVSGILATFLV
jgi:threonine/homoserine/homoserine lactone efflux protein